MTIKVLFYFMLNYIETTIVLCLIAYSFPKLKSLLQTLIEKLLEVIKGVVKSEVYSSLLEKFKQTLFNKEEQ